MTRRFTTAFCFSAALLLLFSFVFSALAFAQGGSSASNEGAARVIREEKHDVSAPLAELDQMTPAQPHRFSPRLLKILPTAPASNQPEYAAPDLALQAVALPPVAAKLGLNIAGLGQGQYGFLLEYSPPDTNGAVGATQYVQWVNAEFAVFDKATGALVAGPTEGNALWHGFGGGCETNNDGDPIVQYDKIADRWVLTQFSISPLPYTQCVAVSTTSDATGTYNRYAFSFGDSDYSDYPKLGVWPDAYYMSFNLFQDGSNFIGADACAQTVPRAPDDRRLEMPGLRRVRFRVPATDDFHARRRSTANRGAELFALHLLRALPGDLSGRLHDLHRGF